MEKQSPNKVFKQYEDACAYKSSLGEKGIYEQSKKNWRFYLGDQWYGAKVGNDKPLVRHNIIKRIGDYKEAVINSSQTTVNFSAEGVPNTVGMAGTFDKARDMLAAGKMPQTTNENDNINLVMGALTDYYKTTSERLRFDEKSQKALHNAYISGTGYLYTYWDESIKTGLYADSNRQTEIKGDIITEVISVENLCLGDPTLQDIQEQPYIIVSMRKSVEQLKREAKLNGILESEIEKIKSDNDTQHQSGDRASKEPTSANKATCLIKLYKEYDKKGEAKVMCLKCVSGVFIKKPFDTKLKNYPIAQFLWHEVPSCGYGESEVTYLIPNQIAINRMLTANVWAIMTMGMPIMLVNNDVIKDPVTNNPGQVISFSGSREDFDNAVKYVTPPNFSYNYSSNANDLINNTLTQAGANDAALGDIKAENTSAIMAVRESATMPMNLFKNRFYRFIEDNARIWAEFWVSMYGNRQLKVTDSRGTYYVPFIADNFKNLIISAKVDVGASTMWSEVANIQSLDNLLEKGIITPVQYLENMPKGVIPNLSRLIKELQAMSGTQGFTAEELVNGLSPEEQQALHSLPPEAQKQLLGGIANDVA